MIFVLVYVRAVKRKPDICKSDGASRFSGFTDREITENLFTVTENILRKKPFVHPLGLRRNAIAGTKRAILSGQYRSMLPLAEPYNKAT